MDLEVLSQMINFDVFTSAVYSRFWFKFDNYLQCGECQT